MWKSICKASNYGVTKAFSKLFFPLEVYGLEHYPEEGSGTLLVLNHESRLDSFFVVFGVEEYQVRLIDMRAFITSQHTDTIYGWFFRALDMFRVERGKGFFQLDPGVEFLREGGHVAIFPEGCIRRGKKRHAKKGVSYILHHSGAPILPIHISYEKSRYLWYRKCIIDFGKVEYISVQSIDEYQEVADQVMRIIDDLPSKRTYTKIFKHY